MEQLVAVIGLVDTGSLAVMIALQDVSFDSFKDWWHARVIEFKFNESLFDLLVLAVVRCLFLLLLACSLRCALSFSLSPSPRPTCTSPFALILSLLSIPYLIVKAILFSYDQATWATYCAIVLAFFFVLLEAILIFISERRPSSPNVERDQENEPLLKYSPINTVSAPVNGQPDLLGERKNTNMSAAFQTPRGSFSEQNGFEDPLSGDDPSVTIPVEPSGQKVNPPNELESEQPVLETSQLSQILKILRQSVGVKDIDSLRISIPASVHDGDSFLERGVQMHHPDLFSKIPDYGTPFERIVAVTRWFLSNFHNQAIPGQKKPLNPLIGEVFACCWNLPEGKVEYFAEQVSHHPPISAFCCRCKEKGIQFFGSEQVVGSFTGTALKGTYKGFKRLKILTHNETYEFKMPTWYLRGILVGRTFVDFVGESTITCRETKFQTKINFKEKPWIGGEYRLIEGEIYDPSGTKLCNLRGKWSEAINIEFLIPSVSKDTLFNALETPRVEKIVKPIDQQCEMESQRIWNTVKTSIQKKDFKVADQAKSRLENLQRKYEKQHKHRPSLFATDPETSEFLFREILSGEPIRFDQLGNEVKEWFSKVTLD